MDDEEEDRTEVEEEVTEEEVVVETTMAREAKKKGTTLRLSVTIARRRDTLPLYVPKEKMKNSTKQKLKLRMKHYICMK